MQKCIEKRKKKKTNKQRNRTCTVCVLNCKLLKVICNNISPSYTLITEKSKQPLPLRFD